MGVRHRRRHSTEFKQLVEAYLAGERDGEATRIPGLSRCRDGLIHRVLHAGSRSESDTRREVRFRALPWATPTIHLDNPRSASAPARWSSLLCPYPKNARAPFLEGQEAFCLALAMAGSDVIHKAEVPFEPPLWCHRVAIKDIGAFDPERINAGRARRDNDRRFVAGAKPSPIVGGALPGIRGIVDQRDAVHRSPIPRAAAGHVQEAGGAILVACDEGESRNCSPPCPYCRWRDTQSGRRGGAQPTGRRTAGRRMSPRGLRGQRKAVMIEPLASRGPQFARPR